MRRVLLTGATTPLGAGLIRRLLGRDDVSLVVAVARPGEMPPVGIDDGRFVFVNADLTRSRGVRDVLWGPAKRANALVLAAHHRSVRNVGRRARLLNVESTRMMLNMAESHPHLERVVYRSFGDVYRVDSKQPAMIDEYHPLNLDPRTPQWIRDRVEADTMVSTRTGLSPLNITVLRFAPTLARNMGSQLYDFLDAPVCFTPLGFDPILNVIDLRDMVRAIDKALSNDVEGIFNIPGRDTLAMSEAIRRFGKREIGVPGAALSRLYRARARLVGGEFDYELNRGRFHWNGVLDGRRARLQLGFVPEHGINWPVGGSLPETAGGPFSLRAPAGSGLPSTEASPEPAVKLVR